MIGKLLKILLCLILPNRIYDAVILRCVETRKIMTSNLALRIFWNVLFFPIVLPFSLIKALLKTILLWLLGPSALRQINYAFNAILFNDITSKTERKTLRVSLKRVALFYELVTKGKERKISCGENNPDKTFYVIRPYYFLEKNELSKLPARLLYNYYRNLQFIAYAVNKGWIPVVDWENYGLLPHQEEYPINGTKNGWEYYWNQPSEYTLAEVYQSKNVVLSTRNTMDTSFMPACKYPMPYQKNAEDCAQRCPKYDQLISFNEYTSKHIDTWQRRLFPQDSRILGVSIRGTDYGTQIIPGHPAPLKPADLVHAIKQYMRLWEMEYVFIACEAENIVDIVKQEFGDKTIVLPRMRYQKEPEVGNNPLYVPGQRYQTNLDYVTEMALLSRCDCLLAGYSGGVRIAVIWNNGRYEHMKIL